MKNIVIFGAGDCGREVASFIEDINKEEKVYNILGFIDSKERIGESCGTYAIIGTDVDIYDLYEKYEVCAVIAMQDGTKRKRIVDSLVGFDNWETIIHPASTINDSVNLGRGTVISPNVCISIDTQIGEHCFLSIGTLIGHDCVVANFVSLMPGSVLCGHVHLGERTYIATNASVVPGVTLGENVMLGVGSVALSTIQDNVTVYGNPGKVIMKRR